MEQMLLNANFVILLLLFIHCILVLQLSTLPLIAKVLGLSILNLKICV